MSQSADNWPKISLVTAVYNGEKYLEETIQSVLQQRYPNLEYILVNDGSTDGSGDIIRQYSQHFAHIIEQPNEGLYPALNAGFAKATGDVLGWLNSNDLLHTNGLRIVGSVFSGLRDVEWITGMPTYFTDEGLPIVEKRLPRWSRGRFLSGANRFIQQESTYWRRSLWERAGGRLETRYRAEGDFDLWVRFFRHARLYTVDGMIAGYRCHPNALSQGDLASYTKTCDEIADRELVEAPGLALAKTFRRVSRFLEQIPKVRVAWKKCAVDPLYRISGADWPPLIHRIDGSWVMKA